MRKKSIERKDVSSPVWEELETWVRGQVQGLIQDILEEEVTAFLGRRKSERRGAVDAPPGYRNGYGKPRKLALSNGTITVRRPRIRDLEERFESRILPLFFRRTKEVADLLPELYLHGLSQGDFDLALRGLLGDGAPLSASSVGRLKAKWQGEYEGWASRSLEGEEVVYLWVDGVYVKAGLEREKAALLVALAGLSDGRKVFVAITPGHRESTESWSEVLRDLKRRGMNVPRLVIGDGHLGIWGALRNVYPEVDEQRCWNHRILNVLDKIPKRHQRSAKGLLLKIPKADTRQAAERLKKKFQKWCGENGCEAGGDLLDQDWDRMVKFYDYPKAHWKHLRTTNPIESPFAAVRLRTNAAKRFKRVENATALIWKTMMIAEQRFRKLDMPELLQDVHRHACFVNGLKIARSHRLEDAA
jgi:transposase-like protein